MFQVTKIGNYVNEDATTFWPPILKNDPLEGENSEFWGLDTIQIYMLIYFIFGSF